MKQVLSWILSILFHGAVAVALFQTVDLKPVLPEKFMEVDLTEMAAVEPEILSKLPTPPPPPMEPVPETEQPETIAGRAPLPTDKTIVLDDSQPEGPPPPAPEPAPTPEPDVVTISSKKTLPPEEVRKDIVDVRKDFVVHRGHEARFGRSMMADYFSYSANEFSGQFRTRDDRVISIIDARNTQYGRFLIYDSKTKTLRRLKQAMGKYVYTVGPSLYEDEPVVGTVTFLAKNDRIERFILTMDGDRLAHYPRKVHVVERDTAFAGSAGDMSGHTTLPPSGKGHAGVVFAYGNLCVPPGMIKGITRDLAMHDLASIAFAPAGCSHDDTSSPTGTDADYAADILAAARHFAQQPQMQGGRIGIWSTGPGLKTAVRITESNDRQPITYLICLLDDLVKQSDLPKRADLASLSVPVLWLATGKNTAKLRPFITLLEELRDGDKHPFTIVVAPTKTGEEVAQASGEQAGWVKQVASDHARLAKSWIKSLDN